MRSSLAVEARLSQWRKETSVLENARVDTPSKNGILKQTPAQSTNKSTVGQRNNSGLKGRMGKKWIKVESKQFKYIANKIH